MLRSLAAEFGIAIAQGAARAIDFAKGLIEGKRFGCSDLAHDVLRVLSGQLVELPTAFVSTKSPCVSRLVSAARRYSCRPFPASGR